MSDGKRMTAERTERASFQFQDIPDRLRLRIVASDATGCWDWIGSRVNGYGSVSYKGKQMGAHRVLMLLANGPPAPGMQVDHLCRNKACCNPEHLEYVTEDENKRRGIRAKSALATHCRNGHELTKENTKRRNDGTRKCRICTRKNQTTYYRRRLRKTCRICGQRPENHTAGESGHAFAAGPTYVELTYRVRCLTEALEAARPYVDKAEDAGADVEAILRRIDAALTETEETDG